MSGKARPSVCNSIIKELPRMGLSKTKEECIRILCELHIPKKIDVVYAPSAGKIANICPNCGIDTFGDNEDKYCSNCGQALDWSDEE